MARSHQRASPGLRSRCRRRMSVELSYFFPDAASSSPESIISWSVCEKPILSQFDNVDCEVKVG